MLVSDILDDIDEVLERTGPVAPDRLILTKWMSQELREIIGKGTWTWAQQHLNPTIATQTGIRNYLLPANFPDNFTRAAGEQGDEYAAMIDDGTNESQLTYIAPELYFTRNIRGTANGRPSEYSIIGSSSGGRELFLFPAPDSNTSTYYTVDGLYQPTDWTLTERDQRPLITGNSPILKFAVLRRLNGDFEAKYQEALGFLRYEQSKSSKARFAPAVPHRNTYSGMR